MTDVIASPHFLNYFDTTGDSPILGAIVSTFAGGAVFGALSGGYTMDRFGRRMLVATILTPKRSTGLMAKIKFHPNWSCRLCCWCHSPISSYAFGHDACWPDYHRLGGRHHEQCCPGLLRGACPSLVANYLFGLYVYIDLRYSQDTGFPCRVIATDDRNWIHYLDVGRLRLGARAG